MTRDRYEGTRNKKRAFFASVMMAAAIVTAVGDSDVEAPFAPPQFHSKIYAEIANSESMMLVLNYDYPNQRTREDYYLLSDKDKPERLYTSIKKYAEGRNYMIFHRAFGGTAMASPESCFISPLVGALLAPDALRFARYLGRQQLQIGFGSDPRHRHTEKRVLSDRWSLLWHESEYLIASSVARDFRDTRPLRVESSAGNYTILEFREGLLNREDMGTNLFDPSASTIATCARVRR